MTGFFWSSQNRYEVKGWPSTVTSYCFFSLFSVILTSWALANIEAVETKQKAENRIEIRLIISFVFKEGSGEWGVGNGGTRAHGVSPFHSPLPSPYIGVSSLRLPASCRRK